MPSSGSDPALAATTHHSHCYIVTLAHISFSHLRVIKQIHVEMNSYKIFSVFSETDKIVTNKHLIIETVVEILRQT